MAEITVLDDLPEGARKALATLQAALRKVGPYATEAKKTSLHFRPGGTRATGPAFAGARPLKSGLRVTIVLASPPKSSRLAKCEQVSRNRWHVELILPADGVIDADLEGWLKTAYALQTAAPSPRRGARTQ
jgi:hypothetical protein